MSTNKLTENQVKQYKDDGFVIIPSVLNTAEVSELRRITDVICAGAKGMTQGDDVYDLEDTHTPKNHGSGALKNHIWYMNPSQN